MGADTALKLNPQIKSPGRTLTFWAEPAVAWAGTGFVLGALVVTALNAGPLWRDETNSINVAQMPSLHEFWSNLPFESFPVLWLLLLRLWSSLGLAGNDLGIRCLGLVIGVFFLCSLWISTRWLRGRTPAVSLALLGSLPAFVNVVGANRAYGLAMALLLLTFGAIWRMVAEPSWRRFLLAGLLSFLFVQCLYYDAIFLCAMLAGGASVALRRRHWKILAGLVVIGAFAGASMTIYLPVIHRASAYVAMVQAQAGWSELWKNLSETVAAQTSAAGPGNIGREIWVYITLFLAGAGTAVGLQFTRKSSNSNEKAVSAPARADLALFSGVGMLVGTAAHFCFLVRLQFPTHSWYYLGLLTLWAISMEGTLGAPWPAFRPWGALRVGFLVLMISSGARPVWEEAHTRRSNVDLLAARLEKESAPGDLIVVYGVWEGISFDRYYHGRTEWVTLPPINSHKVHRTDLVWEKLNQGNPLAPVLDQITRTLQRGNRVWLAGRVALVTPEQLPPAPPRPPSLPTKWYLGPYMKAWGQQVTAHLLALSRTPDSITVRTEQPVNYLEDLLLRRFSPQ